MNLIRQAIYVAIGTLCFSIILGCGLVLLSHGIDESPRPMVSAKPTGKFHTLRYVHVGNNGWATCFKLRQNGSPVLQNGNKTACFCESLPWHKDMVLTELVYEDWVDQKGNTVCWSIQNDRAGYIYEEDGHGHPLYQSDTAGTTVTTTAAETAEAGPAR